MDRRHIYFKDRCYHVGDLIPQLSDLLTTNRTIDIHCGYLYMNNLKYMFVIWWHQQTPHKRTLLQWWYTNWNRLAPIKKNNSYFWIWGKQDAQCKYLKFNNINDYETWINNSIEIWNNWRTLGSTADIRVGGSDNSGPHPYCKGYISLTQISINIPSIASLLVQAIKLWPPMGT